MKITCNWLREYVDYDWDWPELVERLTMSGLEMESVDDLGERLRGVVVGHVVAVESHPNADRLSLCRVDLGDGEHTIVCGAPNVAAGQYVPVARPGASLPGGMEIRRAKIRGVESAGMICSETELGLGDDASGIMVLDGPCEPGVALAAALGLDDVAVDFEVTPNRPDCLSLFGIAREVRALNGAALRPPEAGLAEAGEPAAAAAALDIEDPEGCPRYCARLIRGVRIGPSPTWLRQRLLAVGQRPINNVVDVTNFVMLELGHPLHAFDLALLTDHRIVVRRARAGEQLQTLDGVEHELSDEVLVIADAERPVALAGIMGGLHSGVTEDTTQLVLESAYFEPGGIRKTRQRLDMSTDSSYRFERGADIEMAEFASRRAAFLLAELAGARVSSKAHDAYPAPAAQREVALRPSRVSALLGKELDADEIAALLKRLELESGVEGDALRVSIPSFRGDLLEEIDLIEEVGRLYGFNKLPVENRVSNSLYGARGEGEKLKARVHAHLTGQGFQEVLSSSFMDERDLDRMRLPEDDPRRCFVTVSNPLVSFNEKMRSAMLPGMLAIVRTNFHRDEENLRLYQMGRVYLRREGEALPGEPDRLVMLMTGEREPAHWSGSAGAVTLEDLRGAAEGLLRKLGIAPRLDFEISEPYLAPGQGFRLLDAKGRSLGEGGLLRASLLSDMKPRREIFWMDLCLESLGKTAGGPVLQTPVPAFPALRRDLALLLPDALSWQELETFLRQRGGKLLESLELFDIYRGEGIPEGTKSYAVRLRFRSPEGTLKDEQVDKQIQRLLGGLKDSLNVVLRS